LTESSAKAAYTKEVAIAGANVPTTFGRKNSSELDEAAGTRQSAAACLSAHAPVDGYFTRYKALILAQDLRQEAQKIAGTQPESGVSPSVPGSPISADDGDVSRKTPLFLYVLLTLIGVSVLI
jgi:hypothetical protein